MKKIFVFLICILLLPLNILANDFGEEEIRNTMQSLRVGPFLSLGIGGAYTSFEQTYEDPDNSSNYEEFDFEEQTKIGIDFKLGLSFSQFQLFLVGKAIYIDNSKMKYAEGTLSLIGGGVAYYLFPDIPSLYVSAGVGFLADSTGYYFSIGHEFSSYFSFDISYISGTVENYEGALKTDYQAIMATLNITLYMSGSQLGKLFK